MATTPISPAAPQALKIEQVQPPQQKSQDPTPESPASQQDQYAAFCKQYGKQLIDLQRKIRDSWSYKRRGIISKVMKNKEFDKGNHFTGFWDDGQPFDAFEEFSNFTGGNAKNGDDKSLRHHYSNFYTMLLDAIVAVLSSDIPKNRWMPADADVEDDRQTAKASSKIETIIERANKIKVMVRQELRELGTSGCYFKHTRYVVDSKRTGTRKEVTLRISAEQVVPDRYLCPNCGLETPENALVATKQLACPRCGTPLGQQNFLPSHVDNIPVAEEKSDVANGMVLEDPWGPLHVDADPDAENLTQTRLLDLSVEVPIGIPRKAFPEFYDEIQPGGGSGSSNGQLEKQYRGLTTTPAGYSQWVGYSTPDKVTYSRCWFDPMSYPECDDRALADLLEKTFPDGFMLAYIDELPLQIQPAKLTDEWTHCAVRKGNGLYPPPMMEPGISLQERINDCANIIHDWMDRMAAGILLGNERYIDSKAMNGKSLLPGILNPIITKQGAPVTDIAHMIYQVQTKLEPMIMSYVESLKRDMELLVGAPPQLFGGQGDPHIETKGGQEQQLSQAMGRLGLVWDCLRTEHAESAENAVKCAQKNMTEPWKDVVTDETEDFRNEYVHLDEIKGSVHAEPETDQGFPMTYAEVKDFFMNLLSEANQQLVDWLIQEPKNIDTMLRYVGPPGLVAPGGAMRDKALRVFGQLAKSAPIQQVVPDPMTGQPIQTLIPSVMPVKYLDDMDALIKMLPQWAEEHWDKLEGNQAAQENLKAYFQACVQIRKEVQAELAMPDPGAMGGGQPQPQPATA